MYAVLPLDLPFRSLPHPCHTSALGLTYQRFNEPRERGIFNHRSRRVAQSQIDFRFQAVRK